MPHTVRGAFDDDAGRQCSGAQVAAPPWQVLVRRATSCAPWSSRGSASRASGGASMLWLGTAVAGKLAGSGLPQWHFLPDTVASGTVCFARVYGPCPAAAALPTAAPARVAVLREEPDRIPPSTVGVRTRDNPMLTMLRDVLLVLLGRTAPRAHSVGTRDSLRLHILLKDLQLKCVACCGRALAGARGVAAATGGRWGIQVGVLQYEP